MSSAWLPGALAIGGYLFGSLPFSYWIVRWTRGIDVRSVGSGNPGATNVLRAAGRSAALAALGLDILKGAVPVLLARALVESPTVAAWTAFAAVCGHVFSLFLGFRGGKGVATAAGALGALLPLALGAAAVVFVAVVAATRFVSLGSILGALTFPLVAWLGPGGASAWPVLLPVLLTALLIVVRHRANIGRLLRGEENRLGSRGAAR